MEGGTKLRAQGVAWSFLVLGRPTQAISPVKLKSEKKRFRMGELWLICFPPSKNMHLAALGMLHLHKLNQN